MRKIALLAASMLLGASTLFAQNADIESLSGLSFNFGNPGARSLGMGGAFLGLADDASAAEANPAGLTILRKPEISVEGRNYKTGQTFNVSGEFPDIQDQTFSSFSRRAELTFGSIVLPMKNFSIAAYYHEPIAFSNRLAVVSEDPIVYFVGPNGPVTRQQCIDLGSQCGGFQLYPFGTSVDITLKTFGIAGAWKMGNLSLGLAGRYQKMSEEAFTIRTDNQFNPLAINGQIVDDDHDITFSGGFKWAPSDKFSFGGVYKKGPEFKAPLFFNDLTSNGGFQQYANPKFHAPDTYGIGAAIRPVPVLTISADAVRVKYSNLSENLVSDINGINGADFKTEDATELHVGAEYFFSTKIPFAIRGGYWRDPAHGLKYAGPLTTGNAVAESIIFPGGEDQNHISGGIGLAWPRFQIDAAYDTSDTNKTGSVSFVTRF